MAEVITIKYTHSLYPMISTSSYRQDRNAHMFESQHVFMCVCGSVTSHSSTLKTTQTPNNKREISCHTCIK